MRKGNNGRKIKNMADLIHTHIRISMLAYMMQIYMMHLSITWNILYMMHIQRE